MISVATDVDADRAAALVREAVPERVVTAASIRYRMRTALPSERFAYWKAERDGELIGWALAGLDAFAPVRTVAFCGITVRPEHRRSGVGSALWEVVSAHLLDAGATRVLAGGQSDAGSVAFAEAKGFELGGRTATLALDPRRLPPPPPPPAGVEIVSLARFEDTPESVYEADNESAQDEPGPADFSGMTFESWRRLIWAMPDCDHELSTAALVGGTIVGTSFLYTDRATGRAANAGTGVVRAHRGKGLGLLMKQHSLAAAVQAGIMRVVTQNNEANAPMLAINATLGYEPLSTGCEWVSEW